MKRICKMLFSLLMVMAMVLSFSTAAQATGTEAKVIFNGASGYVLSPGSGYTNTDLFPEFKNVMPGDELEQKITIQNASTAAEYIQVYLQAVVHDEQSNPLTYSEAFENTDGKDQQNVTGQRDETVVSMVDFLSRLNLGIYNGTEEIYYGTAAQAISTGLELGELGKNQSMTLTVKLTVPETLGNEYAHRVGEVDWVILVKAFQESQLTVQKVWNDNGDPNRPKSITVDLLCNDDDPVDTVELSEENDWKYTWNLSDFSQSEKDEWTVREQEVPEGYTVSYKTEGNTTIITNTNDYEPKPNVPPVDLTVRKVWSDMNNKQGNRPGSVIVTLYKGTEEVEKVTLSGANNWTYTWTGLDGTRHWTVQESVPLGYRPYYVKSGNVVTITNMVTLIQTGQLNWPIPVLGSLGALLLLFGGYMMLRKRKNKNA